MCPGLVVQACNCSNSRGCGRTWKAQGLPGLQSEFKVLLADSVRQSGNQKGEENWADSGVVIALVTRLVQSLTQTARAEQSAKYMGLIGRQGLNIFCIHLFIYFLGVGTPTS